MERHRLFVREREDEPAPCAVLEMEHLGNRDAVGRLPQLPRRENGHEHLLPTDGVLLLADHLDDLLVTHTQPSGRKVHTPALTCLM